LSPFEATDEPSYLGPTSNDEWVELSKDIAQNCYIEAITYYPSEPIHRSFINGSAKFVGKNPNLVEFNKVREQTDADGFQILTMAPNRRTDRQSTKSINLSTGNDLSFAGLHAALRKQSQPEKLDLQ
jgi:hypothetical protein